MGSKLHEQRSTIIRAAEKIMGDIRDLKLDNIQSGKPIGIFKFVLQKITEGRHEVLSEAMRLGRSDKRLLEIVSRYYDIDASELNLYGLNKLLWISDPKEEIDIDSILAPLNINSTPNAVSLSSTQKSFLKSVSILGREPSPSWIGYCANKISFDESVPKIECGIVSYIDSIRTCDILEWEILQAVGLMRDAHIDSIPAALTLRNELHSKINNPILDLRSRNAELALSVVIVIQDGVRNGACVGLRSTKGVSVHGGLYGVVPAGMFSIEANDIRNEYSLRHAFYREYLEEIFNRSDLREFSSALDIRSFYNDPNLKYLFKMLESGSAKLLLTGIVMNLLNLRPEICAMLIISDPDWYDRHSNGGGGLSKFTLNPEFKEGQASYKSFDELSDTLLRDRISQWVPPHVAALELALRRAGFVDLPPIHP